MIAEFKTQLKTKNTDKRILAVSGAVDAKNNKLHLFLNNGLTITEDLNKYPEFKTASIKEKLDYEILPSGSAVYWDDLDVHLSVEGIFKDYFKIGKTYTFISITLNTSNGKKIIHKDFKKL